MKKTILIAEDDKKTALALTIRLQAAGYEVLSVPDGFRSFMQAMSRKPDLILMDIGLPFGDGLSVAEELQDSDLSAIPIIFMTASRKKSLQSRAQEIGAAGFVKKPFDSQKLLDSIANVLKRTQSIVPTTEQGPPITN
jgi:DNA-binding response OmpR family regulator